MTIEPRSKGGRVITLSVADPFSSTALKGRKPKEYSLDVFFDTSFGDLKKGLKYIHCDKFSGRQFELLCPKTGEALPESKLLSEYYGQPPENFQSGRIVGPPLGSSCADAPLDLTGDRFECMGLGGKPASSSSKSAPILGKGKGKAMLTRKSVGKGKVGSNFGSQTPPLPLSKGSGASGSSNVVLPLNLSPGKGPLNLSPGKGKGKKGKKGVGKNIPSKGKAGENTKGKGKLQRLSHVVGQAAMLAKNSSKTSAHIQLSQLAKNLSQQETTYGDPGYGQRQVARPLVYESEEREWAERFPPFQVFWTDLDSSHRFSISLSVPCAEPRFSYKKLPPPLGEKEWSVGDFRASLDKYLSVATKEGTLPPAVHVDNMVRVSEQRESRGLSSSSAGKILRRCVSDLGRPLLSKSGLSRKLEPVRAGEDWMEVNLIWTNKILHRQ